MNRYPRYLCQFCQGFRGILFCQECTQLACIKCVNRIQHNELYCKNCEKNCNGEFCGACGNPSQIINQFNKYSCPTCKSTSITDPKSLLKSLDSEFFSIISRVSEVLPEIAELHRSFEFFVTLVRLCRLAGLLGFPQIEDQIEKCSNGLSLITKKGIDQLSKVRHEALFDLRRIQFFKNIQLENYRNAEAIIQSTSKSIQQVSDLIRYWIGEVNEELKVLKRLAIPLRRHYELLSEVFRDLPEGIFNVAAVIPPVGMNVRVGKKKKNKQAYVVFAEEYMICIPEDVKKARRTNKIISAIKILYSNVQAVSISHSTFRGSQLVILLTNGEMKISAPPKIIEIIQQYIDLVLSNEPFMVGSAKTIIHIEENTPNKNDYKNATTKFISVFRDRLFGNDIKKNELFPFETSSIRELRKKISGLQKNIRTLDHQARSKQVDCEEYQEKRSLIKENMRSLQDNISHLVDRSVGGHIAREMDTSNWFSKFDNNQEF